MDLNSILNAILSFFRDMGLWLLDGVSFVFRGLLYLIMDALLLIVTTFFGALDIGSHLFSIASLFGLLPPQLLWLINAVGIPQGLSILAWAIGIRMLINLVPAEFTRL